MPKKLLLADDSVVIQKLVGLSFANEDVEIISTDNGDDAVTLAREVVPDVVLADVVMPGKSGYEVCEAIKQDPALAHIPVLLLTGTFEAFDEARAESSGANGQITKPFEAQALVARVTEVVNAPPAPAPAAKTASPTAPVAKESDFFDADVPSLSNSGPASALSEEDEGDPLIGSDGFPPTEDDFMLDEPGESRSALFGQPSDVMADDVEPVDTMAERVELAPPIDVQAAAPGQSPGKLAPPPLPIAEDAMNIASPSASGEPQSGEERDAQPEVGLGDSRAFADPLEGMSEEFGLHDLSESELASDSGTDFDPLGGISADDVDTALAAGGKNKNATILVAEDDSNARTSPDASRATAVAQVALESRAFGSSLDAGTVRRADESSPVSVAQSSAPPLPPASPPPAVADLDRRLAESPEAAVEPRSTSPTSSTSPGFLDLGPTNLAGDDLDFAFDVSEHLPVSESEDPLEQSYSSLSDISDSQILGDPSEESAPLSADYDVSSSDIATAPPPLPRSHPSEPSQARPSMPTADPSEDDLISIDDEDSQPQVAVADSISRTPDAVSAVGVDARDSVVLTEDGSASLVEDLRSAAPGADSSFASLVEDSSYASPVEDSSSASLVEGSSSASLVEDSSSASRAEDSQSVRFADESDAGLPGEGAYAGSSREPIEVAEEDSGSVDVTDELLVGGMVVAADSAARKVPDLSPMMEQQIQETLEKVAWEAFSDLSESIVKEVMGRVEKIAWEVIPQMAETLVREEIRRMKGEDD